MKYIQSALCTACGNMQDEIEPCKNCGCLTFYLKVKEVKEKPEEKGKEKEPAGDKKT